MDAVREAIDIFADISVQYTNFKIKVPIIPIQSPKVVCDFLK